MCCTVYDVLTNEFLIASAVSPTVRHVVMWAFVCVCGAELPKIIFELLTQHLYDANYLRFRPVSPTVC